VTSIKLRPSSSASKEGKSAQIRAKKLQRNHFLARIKDFSALRNSFSAQKNDLLAGIKDFSALRNHFSAQKNRFSARKNRFSARKNYFSAGIKGFSALRNSLSAMRNNRKVNKYGFFALWRLFGPGKTAKICENPRYNCKGSATLEPLSPRRMRKSQARSKDLRY
jgi:hypothetical protein